MTLWLSAKGDQLRTCLRPALNQLAYWNLALTSHSASYPQWNGKCVVGKGQWQCSAAGKITGGLASHRSCVTDHQRAQLPWKETSSTHILRGVWHPLTATDRASTAVNPDPNRNPIQTVSVVALNNFASYCAAWPPTVTAQSTK